MKCYFNVFGWTFAVDSFAIGFEPDTHCLERGLNLIGNGAVGLGADVEQQVAVFADDIDELMHEELRRLILVVLDIAPGELADEGVRLPLLGLDAGNLAPLE